MAAYWSVIANAIADRVASITIDNGYSVEVTEVVRRVIGMPSSYEHGTAEIRIGDATRDTSFLGQFPWIQWLQSFSVEVTVRPEEPDIVLDDAIGEYAEAVLRAVDTTDQIGRIVQLANVAAIRPTITDDGQVAGVLIEFDIVYQTAENDLSLSPTAPPESESES